MKPSATPQLVTLADAKISFNGMEEVPPARVLSTGRYSRTSLEEHGLVTTSVGKLLPVSSWLTALHIDVIYYQ
ncbi:MAG TPA: hypothetical protein VFO40_21230 [Chthoniobacterales bacterium]|nr:hypothetical protein [Chthoniobacterales bacterium]